MSTNILTQEIKIRENELKTSFDLFQDLEEGFSTNHFDDLEFYDKNYTIYANGYIDYTFRTYRDETGNQFTFELHDVDLTITSIEDNQGFEVEQDNYMKLEQILIKKIENDGRNV